MFQMPANSFKYNFPYYILLQILSPLTIVFSVIFTLLLNNNNLPHIAIKMAKKTVPPLSNKYVTLGGKK